MWVLPGESDEAHNSQNYPQIIENMLLFFASGTNTKITFKGKWKLKCIKSEEVKLHYVLMTKLSMFS